ncbi:MAG: lipid-A-disaccharide synthase, partial [Symploca sp. SIO1B1]|nr:lipid-A-disaccharide synthase [Symploca sp. SIO1B1]
PASRRQELKYMMPIVFEAARRLQLQLEGRGDAEMRRWGDGEMGRWGDRGDVSHSQFPIPNSQTTNNKQQTTNNKQPIFWIPLSLEAYRDPIEAAIKRYGLRAKVIAGKNKEILAAADLAIAKSGTVNLELALLDVPQVVFYRVSFFTFLIGRILKVTIPFMSPPNLVVMRSIVPELLQDKATPENLVKEALELLFDEKRRQQTLADYQEMRQLLGEVGVCDRAAKEIFRLAQECG